MEHTSSGHENCSIMNATVIGVLEVCNGSLNGTHATAGPNVLNLFQNALGIMALPLVMITSGCAVDMKELLKHLRKPWAMLVGMGCQYILLPFLGFCGALAFSLEPNQAVAFIIFSSCPGGPLSNLMTLGFDGDLPLRYVKLWTAKYRLWGQIANAATYKTRIQWAFTVCQTTALRH